MSLLKIAGKKDNGNAGAFSLNNDGVLKTKNVIQTEEVEILNAQLRTGDVNYTTKYDVGKYLTYSLRVENTLDRDVSFIFVEDIGDINTTQLVQYDGSSLTFTIPAASNTTKIQLISSEDFPFLNYLHMFKVKYQAVQTNGVQDNIPTSGSIKLTIVGKY